MKCVEYEIRVRTLGSGLFNALPALKTSGRKGTSLTEVLVECGSGPCTSRHLAVRRAQERTAVYLVNLFACAEPVPLPARDLEPARELHGLPEAGLDISTHGPALFDQTARHPTNLSAPAPRK